MSTKEGFSKVLILYIEGNCEMFANSIPVSALCLQSVRKLGQSSVSWSIGLYVVYPQLSVCL